MEWPNATPNLQPDIDENIRSVKDAIRALERLAGTLVVMAGDTVVTVLRTDRDDQRKLLRRKR